MTKPNGEMHQMTDMELGWVAGIIDGEGCISIACENPKPSSKRTSPYYQLHVDVMMTHLPTIEKLRAITGVGCYKNRVKPGIARNQSYQWRVACKQAAALLQVLRPALVTKAEEVDIAMEFSSLPVTKSCKLGTPPELLEARLSCRIRLQEAKPRTIVTRLGRAMRLELTGSSKSVVDNYCVE